MSLRVIFANQAESNGLRQSVLSAQAAADQRGWQSTNEQ